MVRPSIQILRTAVIAAICVVVAPSEAALGNFKEDCESKNGRVSVQVDDIGCYCVSTKKYFDPHKDKCPKSSPKTSVPLELKVANCLDRVQQSTLHPKLKSLIQACQSLKDQPSAYTKMEKTLEEDYFYDFHSMFTELNQSENGAEVSACSVDRDTVHEKAIKALDAAIARYSGGIAPPPPPSSNPYPNDLDLLIQKWKVLLELIGKADQKNKLPLSQRKEYERMTEAYLSRAILGGIIPVPAFLDEEKEGIDYFRYSALEKYFFEGFAPVSIKDQSLHDLSERNEHVIRAGFLHNMEAIADHDIQHAALMGSITRLMRLEKPAECKKWMACFKDLPDADKPDIRMSLFYILHEDIHSLNDLRLVPGANHPMPLTPLEFAIERTFSQDKFSPEHIVGNTPKEKQEFCSNYQYFREGPDTRNRKKAVVEIDRWMRAIISKESFKRLGQDEASEKALRDYIGSGLIDFMDRKCIPYFKQKVSTHEPRKAMKFIKSRFEAFGQKGFHDAVNQRLGSFLDSMKKLRNNFSITPSCNGLLRLHDPNLMHEAVEKEDWKKVLELADKAPILMMDVQGENITPVHILLSKRRYDVLKPMLEKHPEALKLVHRIIYFPDGPGKAELVRFLESKQQSDEESSDDESSD